MEVRSDPFESAKSHFFDTGSWGPFCDVTLTVKQGRQVVSSPPRSEEQPQTAPTRDVDITYQITRPGQPAILERQRWLASQHLRRVDGPDNSATIFDQRRGELTVLNAANHTYVTLRCRGLRTCV